MLYKFFWLLRLVFLIPFFGKIRFPSYLGKPTFLRGMNRIYINKKVRIYPGSRMEVINKSSSITFNDNIAIGQNFHITSGGKLVIESHCTILGNVMITNIDHDYSMINTPIWKQNSLVKETVIGQYSFIGYGAIIQAGTSLGKHCVVGANSVVRGDFPDYSVIVGSPARIVKRFDFSQNSWRRTDSHGVFI